jgi:hypothetical protein
MKNPSSVISFCRELAKQAGLEVDGGDEQSPYYYVEVGSIHLEYVEDEGSYVGYMSGGVNTVVTESYKEAIQWWSERMGVFMAHKLADSKGVVIC